MPAIEIQNLTKLYGDTVAVKNLSLTIQEGEVFAFLGPNGAGKTTTIKILTGLLRPDEGQIRVAGFDVVKEPLKSKALISYVPDEPYCYEKLTAREFLRFIGDVYGLSEDVVKQKIEELTEVFELHRFLDDLTESFSHGMKQRTVLAAALIHDPRVLIVDEPLVGLDPKSARKLKDTFKRLAKEEGVTIFLSTHTLSVAEEVADTIGILNKGNLVALGDLDEIHRLAQERGGQMSSESQRRALEDLFLELTEE